MELALETYRKPTLEGSSESVGHARVVVRDGGYRALERLEERLRESEQDELMLDIGASDIELELPDECGDMSDCKLRVYLDGETRAGLFHVVGRTSRDSSLVYTEPAMVRLIAL